MEEEEEHDNNGDNQLGMCHPSASDQLIIKV